MIDKKVLDYSEALKRIGIEHTILEHPDLKDVIDVQGYLGLTLADGFSTLIMKADDNFVTLIRRDDCKVDFGKVKKVLEVSNLRMASTDEFTRLTNVPVGAAHVINPGMRTLLDKKLFEKEYLTGGSGSFTCSFRYKSEDLKKIPESRVVEFTEETIAGEKRVFSGIRASAKLHLGNYLGAVKGMLALQDTYECIFSVVDLHTITTPYDPAQLQVQIREVVLDYLGAGLDPQKCHLMIQSQVPEHVELAYLLSTIYPVCRLEDLPTYKEKKLQHPEYVNMGLLYYPVLMAADILLYKAEVVPVGKDQIPHIEVTREFARKFNNMFGNGRTILPEPQPYLTTGAYVPSLSGEGKMSKSVAGSYINLTDNFGEIKLKLAKAVTDEGRGEKFPETGSAANLVTLVELFQGHDRAMQYREMYKNAGIRYGDLKKELAEAIYKELAPIQERRKYYEEKPKLVEEILEAGRAFCAPIARACLAEVKEAMGLS